MRGVVRTPTLMFGSVCVVSAQAVIPVSGARRLRLDGAEALRGEM